MKYKVSKNKSSKHKSSKHKSSKHKSRKTKKKSGKKKRKTVKKRTSLRKRGGSRSYNMDTGEYLTIDDGENVFRKLLSKNKHDNEYEIVNFLMNYPEYKEHNIVTIYDLTEEHIKMEDLPYNVTNEDDYIESMDKAKKFLQSIGIMYLDWKVDNVGKTKDGVYKLFDFDAAGIADLDTDEWIIEPIYLNSYGQDKYLPPTELDNLLFEKNMVERQMPVYDFDIYN